MPVNHPIINNSAHSMMSTAVDLDLFSILINISPFFLTLMILSFSFIIYKNINKFFISEPMNEAQVIKEIRLQTISYAIFMSSITGFMADMYLGQAVSIFIACCMLYVIFLCVKFLSPKK
jgi:uncharacterized membrane protein